MIVYIDTSALTKRYIREAETAEVQSLIMQADLIATATVTRPEFVAAIAKARRTGLVWNNVAIKVLDSFREDWADYRQLPITDLVIEKADIHAWHYQLRGFDAIHLAVAHLFQESLLEPVTLATFDKQLWQAAQRVGLGIWPLNLA